MNILIVHNKYKLVGGEDAVAVNEGELLEKKGNKVFYYIRNNSEIDNMNVLQKVCAAFGTIYSFKSHKEINKIIKNNNIDVVHIHNTVPLISLSSYYAAKKNNCRLVQSIHNMRMLCPKGTMLRDNNICEDCINKNLLCAIKHNCYRDSKIQTIFLTLSIAFHRLIKTYDLVDAYLVTTKFNYDMLSKVVDKNKIFYKPYYLDAQTKDLDNKTRDYYIYISRLEYMKGIHIALEAFKDLPNLKLKVLGIGPDEEKSKQYVKENNMQNVEFLGFKNLDEMRELLFNAKALVFPTQWYEGFPMTIVESFALGTPVIGSNIGNVGSIIEDGENGLKFEYNNSKSLSSTISYYEKNKQLIEKIENGAQEYFVNNHDPDFLYKTICNIYN